MEEKIKCQGCDLAFEGYI